MITTFIVESVVMFVAGWVLSQRRYDKRLATKSKEVVQLIESLNRARAQQNVLTARLNAANAALAALKHTA
jgi:hypothetical protein